MLLLRSSIRQFSSIGSDDDVRTRSLLCMEPPVIPNCKMESELVILQIIFTDIDMETVTGDIVERFIIYFDFLFCISAADVS